MFCMYLIHYLSKKRCLIPNLVFEKPFDNHPVKQTQNVDHITNWPMTKLVYKLTILYVCLYYLLDKAVSVEHKSSQLLLLIMIVFHVSFYLLLMDFHRVFAIIAIFNRLIGRIKFIPNFHHLVDKVVVFERNIIRLELYLHISACVSCVIHYSWKTA